MPFYDTDAMGVVHHARYVHYLELVRVRLLEEHHRPYTDYVERGLHFAVTRLGLDYHRGVGFDARLAVYCSAEATAENRMLLATCRKGTRKK